MDSDCLFCKISRGEISSEKIFENDSVVGFKDINPQAYGHLLFINKKHSENFLASSTSEITETLEALKKYISDNSLGDSGYRIVTNHGADAGQTVFHTHFHLLFGEKLSSFGS